MMFKRKLCLIIIILVSSCFPSLSNAQTEVLLTQHWQMPTLLNPAATGDIDFIRIGGATRLQFLGSAGSPKNFMGSVDAPFRIGEKRIGAGVMVESSSFDLFENIILGAQGSYKFNLKRGKLSIGLQLGYFHTKFKGSELRESLPENSIPEEKREGEEDNAFPISDLKGGKFDFSLGLRYDSKNFYLGVSGLHLTNSLVRLKENEENSNDYRFVESKLPATFYLDTGGNIDLKNTLFTLQPSLLLATDFRDFNALVEMRATYNQKFTFGIDYRYNRAAGFLAGVMLKDFYIGYSWEYDYSFKPKGSTGNHELVLGYRLKMNMERKKVYTRKSIRIM